DAGRRKAAERRAGSRDYSTPALQLRRSHEDLKKRSPRIRPRDAAAELGVSEAELLACRAGGDVIRLREEWPGLIRAMPSLGIVKTITRNESAVHEKVGSFDQIHIDKAHSMVLDPEINLRLMLRRWAFGF